MKHCCNETPLIFKIIKFFIVLLITFIILNCVFHNSSLYYRKIISMPFSLHLNKQDIYMIKGEETHLSVFGFYKRIKFQSTNFRVAGVNFNGRVFAYRTGSTFIIAKVNGKVLKCRVHVIDMNKKHIRIKAGKYYRLHIKGSGAFVQWKSSNKSVASVNMFGNVKGRRKGKVVITAKLKGRLLKCTVNVV